MPAGTADSGMNVFLGLPSVDVLHVLQAALCQSLNGPNFHVDDYHQHEILVFTVKANTGDGSSAQDDGVGF